MPDCNAEALDIAIDWRIADSRPTTIEQLYDEHSESLFRYALAITASREDAEDAVQDVFTRLTRSNPSLSGVQNVRRYLLAGVRNAAFSVLRKRRTRNEQALADEYPTSGGESPLASLSLKQAFEQLPPDQREVVVLKIYEGMTFAEIASAVESPVGTVTSRYNYALRKLRAALGEESE